MTLELDAVEVQGILHNCSLSLNPGSITALVGATASGKSTLCNFIARHRDPDGGEVIIRDQHQQGLALPKLDMAELRRSVQIVFQDSFLFSATVRDNVKLAAQRLMMRPAGKPRAAAADEFVSQLSEGLDTIIGEKGVTLSGGQKQRLCLARALIVQPRLLILDDATSALDALTEAKVLSYVREQAPAVLLVASRMASIQQADQVAVLDDGGIVACGPHQQLLQQSARYRELLCVDEVDDAA